MPLPPQEAENICHGPSESSTSAPLSVCSTAWYGNCLASDCKALHMVVSMAQYITGAKFPAIQDLYTMQCQRKALKLSKTPATQVINCSLCYRMASGTDAPSL